MLFSRFGSSTNNSIAVNDKISQMHVKGVHIALPFLSIVSVCELKHVKAVVTKLQQYSFSDNKNVNVG